MSCQEKKNKDEEDVIYVFKEEDIHYEINDINGIITNSNDVAFDEAQLATELFSDDKDTWLVERIAIVLQVLERIKPTVQLIKQ